MQVSKNKTNQHAKSAVFQKKRSYKFKVTQWNDINYKPFQIQKIIYHGILIFSTIFFFCFSGICPLLCSGHGVYGGGECHCTDGWKGSECDVRASECLAADCSAHGQCREGVCICNPGWTGEHCQTRKIPSTYLPVNNISCYPAFILPYSRLLLKEKQKF